ncbi:hypothetical protein NOR_07085 [Metarhizium rileyi]|uniref:HNH nuclease domain-containing protein n=1 Tax=Metarhizium rileyi (strain RCEF 4871) TaxID=1649241 RepID=A0A166YZG5_METRR|nr:hypothetical protein NOR_07085 [Metarhizium rileyi RCEF 4871]
MASAHHRHQSSLDGFISFSSSPPLETGERALAAEIFFEIIEHYENNKPSDGPYNRLKLLHLTYEYATSEKSKDNILQAFFNAISLPINQESNIDFSIKETEELILAKLSGFADYLIDNFFLPLKASTKRTSQLLPAYHSATQSTRAGGHSFIGTVARLKTLRGDCLQRDRHRCVISRRFDQDQAIQRWQKSGATAQDDSGEPLTGQAFDSLEVAHILPHSLVKSNSELELDTSREAALQILNMFDHGVSHLIDGPEIDRPRNALTLTHNLHLLFGDFQIYFEPVDGEANTYRIDTFLPPAFLNHDLPVTRTLFLTEERVIEPPSPRFLAIHRAIAHILHLSAAGPYIDEILEDMDQQSIRVDGSTPIGRLVQLRINGWMNCIGV